MSFAFTGFRSMLGVWQLGGVFLANLSKEERTLHPLVKLYHAVSFHGP